MKQIIIKIIIAITLHLWSFELTLAQAPGIQWQKCLGGSGPEESKVVLQTPDGGYIIGGTTNSFDGDVSSCHGNFDFWIVKVNDTGAIQWEKSYGGSDIDLLTSMQLTKDGGFILCGVTNSTDGDVVRTDTFSYQAWVVKLNSTGVLQWEKTYGGSDMDEAIYIDTTSDSGYIFTGLSRSRDGDIVNNYGYDDVFIIKINDTGAIQWSKNYGGTEYDYGATIHQTIDQGYIIAAYSNSWNRDVKGLHADTTAIVKDPDYWVFKINDTGKIQWSKCYGGSIIDHPSSLSKTLDGGYVITGKSYSTDGDVTGNHGGEDYWVVKIDDTGRLQWQKSLGSTAFDEATNITQTPDSGYLVLGYTLGNDGDVTGHHGVEDYWVVKIDDTGRLQWQKTYGGTWHERPFGMAITRDSGIIVTGHTQSYDGDVSGNHGANDIWLVKLKGSISTKTLDQYLSPIKCFPNPTSDFVSIINNKPEPEQFYSIFDILGRLVITGKLDSNNQIDMSILSPGQYYIKLGIYNIVNFPITKL